ncbi:VCBS repeat-containing protein [Streptomyces sp. PKU-EA00015]|uniref:FG-GAP repeat domain-containing protein n=1 Tax=Streptomyces sp. PKU-EA00015 TaxID=2748326 RepID=UPI0015A1670B|nr:VCBS repeat-containing protein [Streptomyces sp. PKU-EA00015]NWF27171.1 VCBS repeat-containing protein [Streptomyces sp. PKU-EA00015]
MSSKRTGRPAATRRLAACTALALSVTAGALLASPAPAFADEPPAPRATVEQPARDAGQLPSLDLPRPEVNRGAFSAQEEGAPLAAPRSDVDGDGWSDMLFQNVAGRVFVSTGNGEPYEYRFDDGIHESIGQFYKDVFSVAGLREGGPVHFTLTSTGRLSAYANSADHASIYWSGTGWQQFNKVFSPGDLTGDGVGDVLARTFAGDLYLYRATPAGAEPLAPRVKVGSGWGQYDQLVGMNDVNNDGIADLFARNTAGDLFFYSGTGEPTRPFKDRVKVGSGWNIFNTLFSLDDLDEDGNAELYARANNGDLYRYTSTGTGAFLPRVKEGGGWNPVFQFANAGNVSAWGKDELYGLDTRGTLYYYWDLNNGQFEPRFKIGDDGGWAGAKLTHASSLDDNGYSDLLEVYNGTLYNLSHKSEEVQAIGSGWGVYNTLVGPGDLSGDGKGDLLARNSAGELFLYRGNGTGTGFAAKQRIGSGWGQFNVLVGAGDISGDGRADLIARAKDGSLYLYQGTGVASAPFKAKKLIGTGWNQYNKFAAPGDMTGDGRADLVARTSDGVLYRYDSDGKGGFKPKAKIGTGWNTYTGLY